MLCVIQHRQGTVSKLQQYLHEFNQQAGKSILMLEKQRTYLSMIIWYNVKLFMSSLNINTVLTNFLQGQENPYWKIKQTEFLKTDTDIVFKSQSVNQTNKYKMWDIQSLIV